MLPNFLVPYKHYPEETIAGVLDGDIHPDDEDTDDRPSEWTMDRWKLWLEFNKLYIEGMLRSIAYRELGFSEELLKSGKSLLYGIRSSIPNDWLRFITRFLHNAGGSLRAVY